LKRELEELEQDELNERLSGAERVPVHMPPGARTEGLSHPCSLNFTPDYGLTGNRAPVAVEDDEEAQLRELQAALAM
jgi:charged multivesicular body protein 4